VERLGLGVAALKLVKVSQPGNGDSIFRVVLAILLTRGGRVPLGDRYRIGVFALLELSAVLRFQIGELTTTLPSRVEGADGCQQRHQY
jgi:hypothetical protein